MCALGLLIIDISLELLVSICTTILLGKVPAVAHLAVYAGILKVVLNIPSTAIFIAALRSLRENPPPYRIRVICWILVVVWIIFVCASWWGFKISIDTSIGVLEEFSEKLLRYAY
jgi:hypothetical protein